MSTVSFGTEMIDLPSKGVFYPENSPLHTGQVELKYMTAREEDILTSANLIKKGVVLDKLMDALIVTKGVTHNDFLLGDLNAVMVASRIMGYGKNYPMTVKCPACGKTQDHVADLSELDTKDVPVDIDLKFTLPLMGKTVKIRFLTRRIEKDIQHELEQLKKMQSEVDPESSTRLRYLICEVDGSTDPKTIRETAESMRVSDARDLRAFYKSVSPDVSFESKFTCESCNHTGGIPISLGLNFFWPDARVQITYA